MNLHSSRVRFTLLLLAPLLLLAGFAQDQDHPKPQQPQATGVSTGTPHAAVKDALSRPITAGGFGA